MKTTVCIVGAGPGGSILALLMARAGIATVLLEAHGDFDRKFRGDTIHPSTMELMEELGLADRLLELPHAKIRRFSFHVGEKQVPIADFGRTRLRYPYITMLPQSLFIDFVVKEAKRFPHFQILLHATAHGLIEQEGKILGVKYRDAEGAEKTVEAQLTVGADGRSSQIRRLAGFIPNKTAPPMDILWFTLPRYKSDSEDNAGGYLGRGRILVVLTRAEEWQVGYVFPKGEFQKVRAKGMEALQQAIREIAPWLGDRAGLLNDWNQVSVLSVESSRCEKWYRQGLLLIGDAAHVMSPVGGVGINCAIQDAVEAYNQLVKPLQESVLTENHLAEVQRKREWPTRIIQFAQGQMQRFIVASALNCKGPAHLPPLLNVIGRVPILRQIPIRLMTSGARKLHLRS